jgi:hypothetical protein
MPSRGSGRRTRAGIASAWLGTGGGSGGAGGADRLLADGTDRGTSDERHDRDERLQRSDTCCRPVGHRYAVNDHTVRDYTVRDRVGNDVVRRKG